MSATAKGDIQLLLKANRLNDAKKLCKSLCKKNKKDPEAWFLLGSIYAQTAEFENAIDCLRRSILINNRVAITHNNLGLVHLHNNQFKQAQHCFESALKLEPDSVTTLFNLGNALRATQQLDKAEATFRKALQLNPDLAGVINNLGLTLYDKGEPAEAERCFLRSLEIDPRQNNAYRNLANSCREQRRVADAEQALRKVLKLYPEMPEIHWDLSLVLLELGKFEEGWSEYEWRLKGGGTMSRDFPIASWEGEDISEKTILVTAEQGIGDEVMFSSCFPDLINCAQQVIIDCEPRLAPLFSRSFAKAVVHASRQTDDISWLDQIPTPDVQISAASLPRHFRGRLEDFPEHSGYLKADPAGIEKWRHRYSQLGQKHSIGISWKGGHVSQAKKRSSRIEDWGNLLELPGINFINLQYGDIQADLEKASDLFGTIIHHWHDSDPLKNMDQFAAQIAALDLVISIDNSTVHLAGALGKQVWVIQPFCPDWRWMEQSEKSHWYPSVRQLHPEKAGYWKSVIDNIAGDIPPYLSANSV